MEPNLSPREKEIVDLAKNGMQIRRMAEILFVTESAVKNRLTNIFKKYGVRTRFELIAELHRRSAGVALVEAEKTCAPKPEPGTELTAGTQPRLVWDPKYR